MPSHFGTKRADLTWNPNNRPMFNVGDYVGEQGDLWKQLIHGILDLIPGAEQILEALGPLFEKITGRIDATIDDVAAMFTSTRAFLRGIDLFSPDFDPINAGKTFVREILRETGMLLFPDSPLWADNLYGTAPSDVIGNVHLGALGSSKVSNFFANPIFSSADSISGSDDWAWDGTRSHSLSPNAGSAVVILDGTEHDLYSNQIDVHEKQQVRVNIWVNWQNVVSTGNPIRLQIVPYKGTVEQPAVDIDVIPAPTSDSTDQLMTGTYTVPPFAQYGIDGVRIRLYIDPSGQSGTVAFSDGLWGKTVMPGIAPVEWTEALDIVLNNMDQFAQNVIDHLHLSTGATPPAGGAFLTDLQNAFQTWKAAHDQNVINTGTNTTNIGQNTTNLSQLLNDVLNGLRGHAGSGSAQYSQFSDQAAVIADLQAAVQRLQTQQNAAGYGGNSAFVDFSKFSDASSLSPAGFNPIHSESGSGTFVISGGNAIWSPSYDNNSTIIAPYTLVQTLTDYQIVGAAYISTPDWFNGSAKGTNILIARAGSDGNTYVYLFHDAYSYEWGCVVNGTKTVFRTGNWRFKGSGVSYLVAGMIGGLHQFQILDGTTVIDTYVEPLPWASLNGSAYRYGGVGGRAVASSLGSNNPGGMAAFAVADNQPPTLVGSGAKMTRTNTQSGYSISSGNNRLTNCFDTIAYNTADLLPIAAQGWFQVINPGWYHLGAQLYNGSASWPSRFTMQAWKGNYPNTTPTAWRYMSHEFNHGIGQGGANLVPQYFEGSLVDYFYANDLVALGYESSDSVGLISGDAAGIKTVLTMSLINRSLA